VPFFVLKTEDYYVQWTNGNRTLDTIDLIHIKYENIIYIIVVNGYQIKTFKRYRENAYTIDTILRLIEKYKTPH
jgi:hypothetical protein